MRRDAEDEYVNTTDATLILDRQQLSDITLEDQELMREVLAALIADTSQQVALLANAIRDQDSERCKRLAHYCRGACANVGANSAAAVLRQMEMAALARNFDGCSKSLAALAEELELLKAEAIVFQ
jgi:HPt (histidine-containing phosphotransfer) domain-containing protein